MSRPIVRLADAQDAPAIAELIHALETHYGGAPAASALEATLAMVETSMREGEGTRYALASLEGRAVGLACFALLRPGFKLTGLLFVKELFVTEDARGQAVGVTLLRWLADYARKRGVTRIDLTTDGANTGAQAFYERLGAERMNKVFYRFNLSGAALTGD